MPIDITMLALSPAMETGTLARWRVKVGDPVKLGDDRGLAATRARIIYAP